jgi:hypothetical protein
VGTGTQRTSDSELPPEVTKADGLETSGTGQGHILLKVGPCQALVAHTCNPSYSGGRDQEELSSKPAWINSSRDPILKNLFTKRAGEVAEGIGPEFKPQ